MSAPTEIVGIHDWIKARLGKPPHTGRRVGVDRGPQKGKARGTRIHAELLQRIRKEPPPEKGYHHWTERLYKYLKRCNFTLDPTPPPDVIDPELGFHTKVDLVVRTPEGHRVLVELKTSIHEARKTKLKPMRRPFSAWFPHDSVENRAVIQVLMPVLALRELYKQNVCGLVIFIRPTSIQHIMIKNELYSMNVRDTLLGRR